jgi:histidyl-tRNA synthetase
MRRFPLAVAVACLSTTAWSQGTPVQLCVANMQISSTANADPAGQTLLLKFLAKEKHKSVATEIPIAASLPDQAMQEAKAKNCDYLVTTQQTESYTENSQMPMMGTMSQTAMPTFYVTTRYQLTKVSDGSEVISGSEKASDRGSEQNAIGFTMHKIAGKVTQALKKAGPAVN